MTVPDILQRLVAHHGIDAGALGREISRHGRVRTRTWMAGPAGQRQRHVLGDLPTSFPAFKAELVDGDLRVEGLKLGHGVTFRNGATFSRISMPWPDLPETVIAALPGRPLAQLLGHPGIGATTMITSVRMDESGDVPRMVLELDMPRDRLRDVGGSEAPMAMRDVPDLHAIIAETHDAVDAPPLDEDAMTDTRTWEAELGVPALRTAGVTTGTPVMPNETLIAIRFPFDKVTAKEVGRGGVGAWFDRNGYAWQLEPTEAGIAWLRGFLASRDVIVGPDGRIHCRRKA